MLSLGGQDNSIDNTFSGFSVEKIRLLATGALENECASFAKELNNPPG